MRAAAQKPPQSGETQIRRQWGKNYAGLEIHGMVSPLITQHKFLGPYDIIINDIILDNLLCIYHCYWSNDLKTDIVMTSKWSYFDILSSE